MINIEKDLKEIKVKLDRLIKKQKVDLNEIDELKTGEIR